MDLFANRADRLEIFQEAAARLNITPIVVEKDFWVCWTLKKLFGCSDLAQYLTFKGGTSLSKAFSIIERFSEDIDLTIGRDAPFIKDVLDPLEEGISGKAKRRRLDSIQTSAGFFIQNEVMPRLQTVFAESLDSSEKWSIIIDENDPQTLLFQYPRILSYGASIPAKMPFSIGGYIQPQIKLEFGARGEREPNVSKTIRPYVAEVFPEQFSIPDTLVTTLAVERTFWEKTTILHALCHGTQAKERMSRHCYDLHMMVQKGVVETAINDPGLLEQVVRNKSFFFADRNASYETAKIGSLRLVPEEEILATLRIDYEAMQVMFLKDDIPTFSNIIGCLKELESSINSH